MPNPVADAAERFRAQALARERAAATRMVRAYARVYRALDAQVEALENATRGRNMTPNQIRRLSVMAAFRNQIVEQVGRFGVYAEQTVMDAIDAEIGAGLRDAEALVLAHFDIDYLRQQGINGAVVQGEIRNAWNRLPVETIETIVGMTGDDSPLHDALVRRLGPALADHATTQLVNGIALGKNPRVVARQIMGAGLTWAMTTARTAMLNAYRESSHQSYRANRDIVSGWIWHAHLDKRTCVSCLAKHGSRHSVDERLEDHHNGRCAQIPIVPLAQKMGIPVPDIGDSEAWFNAQPDVTQKAIMGKGLLEGYKSGRWGFRDLTTTYDDPVYGTMWRAPTLTAMNARRGQATTAPTVGQRGTNSAYVRGRELTPNDLTNLARELREAGDVQLPAETNAKDAVLDRIIKAQGFDGLPEVLSVSETNRMVSNGEATRLYRGTVPPYQYESRGLSERHPSGNANEGMYVRQYKYGEFFVGEGRYGNGVYAATSPGTALEYAGDIQGDVIRMVLRREARIATQEQIENEHARFMANRSPNESDDARLIHDAIGNDVGRFAAYRGYDGIHVEHSGYFVLLNRTATVADFEDWDGQ